MDNKIKGTSADRPGNANLFDFVKCENCVLYNLCKTKDNKAATGCHFGVCKQKVIKWQM